MSLTCKYTAFDFRNPDMYFQILKEAFCSSVPGTACVDLDVGELSWLPVLDSVDSFAGNGYLVDVLGSNQTLAHLNSRPFSCWWKKTFDGCGVSCSSVPC